MPDDFRNNNSLNSIYGAMESSIKRLGVINTNLQNINTVGFKQVNPDSVIFSEVLKNAFRDEEQGASIKTENKLDLALSAPGSYFLVEGENGPERTRDGHFFLNDAGKIVNFEGKELVVLETDGKPMNFHMTEDFEIAPNGSISSKGKLVGRIAIDYEEQNPGEISYILQGTLEGSNVDLIKNSTEMLRVKRHIDTLNNMLSMDLATEKDLIERYGRNV